MEKRLPKTSPRIVVEVTQRHIDNATPRDSAHCMIADAVKDACPTARHVSVDLATIRFTDPDKHRRYTYLTPRLAQSALVKFDQGIPPEPITILLRDAMVTATRAAQDSRPKAALQPALDSGKVPVRVGGRTPPVAALSSGRGRIRSFGLRQLDL